MRIENISEKDLNELYTRLYGSSDFNEEFEANPVLREDYDKLIKLAWHLAKGLINLTSKKSDNMTLHHYEVADGIDFDESEYEELNENGGISIVETVKAYELESMKDILGKYDKP